MVDLFWAALIPGAMGLAAALVGMSFAIRERRRVLRADKAARASEGMRGSEAQA
jgi:hypothetical protein